MNKRERLALKKILHEQEALDRQVREAKKERERFIKEAEEKRRASVTPEITQSAYSSELKRLAEEDRKREDYFRRLEAMPDVQKAIEECPELPNTPPDVGYCKICGVLIKFIDHGTCRKCRGRLSRYHENKKIRDKLKFFNCLTTQSVAVDSALRVFFPAPTNPES